MAAKVTMSSVAVYGLASGLVNTSQEIGAALGLAILSAIATARIGHLSATRHPVNEALTLGFRAAFLGAAGFVALAAVAAATIGTGRHRRQGSRPPTARPGLQSEQQLQCAAGVAARLANTSSVISRPGL
jgi:hypothetical protein